MLQFPNPVLATVYYFFINVPVVPGNRSGLGLSWPAEAQLLRLGDLPGVLPSTHMGPWAGHSPSLGSTSLLWQVRRLEQCLRPLRAAPGPVRRTVSLLQASVAECTPTHGTRGLPVLLAKSRVGGSL